MPSGKTHDKLTVVTAAAAIPIWYSCTPTKHLEPLLITLGAYIFSGFWLSDDLDTRSVAYRRWGALRFLWWPYQKMVPHRSWLSHGLGIGPLLRVAYLLLMLWLTAKGVCVILASAGIPVNGSVLLVGAFHSTLQWAVLHPSAAVYAALGLILGGLTHSVADILVSRLRRL